MKNYFPGVYIFIISMVFLNIACENPAQTDYSVSHLKGFVIDTVTLAGLDSVSLSIPELSLSSVSFSSGYFQFLNIHMPRDPVNTTVTAKRNGYQDVNQAIVLVSGDTSTVTIMMFR